MQNAYGVVVLTSDSFSLGNERFVSLKYLHPGSLIIHTFFKKELPSPLPSSSPQIIREDNEAFCLLEHGFRWKLRDFQLLPIFEK